MASNTPGLKVGAIIGAVLAAVPAVPVFWIGFVFSFGDEPHPIVGAIRAIFWGLSIIGVGALCGGLIGAAVARITKR